MNKEIKYFLDEIFELKKGSFKYYTFGYQEEYRKKANYDFGYIPFINGLEFEEIEDIISLKNPNNRCGKKKESTEYIVVHDTASGAPSANALAHQKWLNSMAENPDSTYSVSWHFTVDDHTIRQHLPTDEIGYHAGDGTKVPLEFIKTDIKYSENTNITIDSDGVFCINGAKTTIQAPKTDEGRNPSNDQLPTQGINFKVDDDGFYYLSNTYWNSGYKVLANRGGNLNSVGIETCVNYGGDYTKTMRLTAYLVAKLLIKYNLSIDKVKQHNAFSGKNCPMTMRYNNRWNEFLNLVLLNKKYLDEFKENQITFISLTPEYLDNSGKIIKFEEGKDISYKVIVNGEECYYNTKLGKLNFKINEE